MINSRCTSSPSLSIGLVESTTARGKGWRIGSVAGLFILQTAVRVAGVMWGLSRYVFIVKASWPHGGLRLNPSWHLTPVGVVSSADAGHVVVPAWLSFYR